MEGCEPHSENFGGTILMTRRSNQWVMLWYKPGVQTDRCHKVALDDGREILVCIGMYGAQGNNSTVLYVEDLRKPEPTLMAGDAGFFKASDNTLTCGYRSDDKTPVPLVRGHIEQVEFKNNGRTISIIAGFGKRSMSREDVQRCLAATASTFVPVTRRHQIEFVFDGHTYSVAP